MSSFPQNTETETPQCNCDSEPTGSRTGTVDGRLTTSVSLPAYSSLGQTWPLGLVYESDRGGGQAFIKVKTELVPQFDFRNTGSPRPNALRVDLKVGGISYPPAYVNTQTIPINRNDTLPVVFDLAVPMRDFISGVYPYTVTVTAEYPFARFSDSANGEITLLNEAANPWGTGWLWQGLSHLQIGASGHVFWVDPYGDHSLFRWDGSGFISPPTEFSILARNPDGSYTLTDKVGTQTEFNARGLQTARSDRHGNTTTYRYNSLDQLTRITDPLGLSTEFSYSAGQLAQVSDPGGRITRFQHDGEGHLTTVIFPDGSQRQFSYDQGLLQSMTNERNQITTYEYNAFGQNTRVVRPDQSSARVTNQAEGGLISAGTAPAANPRPAQMDEAQAAVFVDARAQSWQRVLDRTSRPVKITDPLGRVTEYVRDSDGLALQTIRPNNTRVTRAFDALGNMTLMREETNGAAWRYSYDLFSQVTSSRDPKGQLTTYERDPLNGNLDKLINALGHETWFEYNSRGQVTRRTDPNGLVSDYSYNPQGLVETITETPPPGGGLTRVTQLSYDAAGQLLQSSQPDGVVLDYAYDSRGRLLSLTDNLGQVTRYTYDDYGNIIQTERFNADGSLANTVTNTYDGRQRLIQSIRPHDNLLDAITTYGYDANNNLTTLTDPKHQTLSHLYDPVNRLQQTAQRDLGQVSYEYNTIDRLIQLHALDQPGGPGVTTDYDYDPLGRQTLEISPDRGTLSNDLYDLNNNVTQRTDARGIIQSLSYDELDRPTLQSYPDPTEDVSYDYDSCPFGSGRLCARTDESGVYDYHYDSYGNLIQLDYTSGGVTHSTAYTYDNGHQLSQMTLPSGRVVSYQRDALRRLSGLETTVNGQPVTVLSNIQYRADGQITQCSFGNGLIDTRNYDLQSRLRSQTLTDGTATILDERTYTYDLNGNLTSRTVNSDPISYSYDAEDRLIEEAQSAQASSFDYDLIGNRQTRSGETNETYTYQAQSNRLVLLETDDSALPVLDRSFIYNDANRLTQVLDSGQPSAAYTVNASGQRTRKVSNGNTTIYHYDQQGQLIAETQADGTLIREYLWANGQPLAQIDHDNGLETLVYLHTDHLLTPRLASDSAGVIIWRWDSAAFGDTAPEEDPDGNGVLTTINLRLPGQYFDPETGLHYNYHRDYNPTTGRYVQSDPIGLLGGLNTYAYVGGNPLLAIDPYGLAQICCRLLSGWLFGEGLQQRHCYVKADDGTTYGLFPEIRNGRLIGVPTDESPDAGGICKDCPAIPCEDQNQCFRKAHNSYPIGYYNLLGPNSNTYAGTLAKKCCAGGIPSGLGSAPGINGDPPESEDPPSGGGWEDY